MTRPLISLLLSLVTADALAAQPIALSASALGDLATIYAEKASRSPAERKLDTALVHRTRGFVQPALLRGGGSLDWEYVTDPDGRVAVDVSGLPSSEEIERLGGVVTSSYPQYNTLRAYLPFDRLLELAELDEVERIRHAIPPVTSRLNTSEGDIAHRANQARSQLGVNGGGVKVGVLSDSIEKLASLQASGDLPAVTVLPGQSGTGASEGTAMLEIVHDLAPGAQLYFATAFESEAGFANNILALAAQGCKVIVDDVSYFSEGVFQDDLIAQAVNTVTAQGVAYFSSAGNSGNLTSGESGVWEGNFVAGGSIDIPGTTGGTVHDFGGGVTGNQVTQAASAVSTLQWSDPLGASANDYDLCVFNSTMTSVIGCSTDIQNGSQDPFEAVPAPPVGSRLVVINYDGAAAPRFLHLSTNRGRLAKATSGQTSGHSAAVNAFSVAAVDVATAHGGAFTGGAANPVEDFSSDGPRRVFYQANGTPLTPGNFLASGGAVRTKPDIAAADGVATGSGPSFNPFFGTSAAAPHAAAIAALMLDAKPSLTLAALRSALLASARDIMAPGVDRDSGAGLIDALAAVQAVSGGGGGGGGACVRTDTTACLLANRFAVDVEWARTGDAGDARVMSFGGQRTENDQSVFFYFFTAANFEMGVKLVNGCGLNGHYWVFVSGLTNQGWTVNVRDTATGAIQEYTNPVGQLSATFADTGAFACN